MSYLYSNLDRENLSWFKNNGAINSLLSIDIENGNLRGLFPFHIDFSYPITTFVGENGSGKSTLLALASCAFHNDKEGNKQHGRNRSYYTFGDFFTFSKDEPGIGGINIQYGIKKIDTIVVEERYKKPSGKWNDYNKRTCRNVVYLGVNRIVPPSESSAHRVYSKLFTSQDIDKSIKDQIVSIMSRILGKNYSNVELAFHSYYQLLSVDRDNIHYSGFNMGAGEHAVLSVLIELFAAGEGSLLVIDEIELGLHARAQKVLINELKAICKELKCQIVCSTHSSIVLNTLPPEARFFIESTPNKTNVIPEISSDYAFGKLAGDSSNELSVFVEDEVAKSFLQNILSIEIRERIKIIPIGSDQAILRQMAAYYREKNYKFFAIFDGDKRKESARQVEKVKKHLEDRIDHKEDEFEAFVNQHKGYLPGRSWPEKVLVESIYKLQDKSYLVERWEADAVKVNAALEQAIGAQKHSEFYTISKCIYKEANDVRSDCIALFKMRFSQEIQPIVEQFSALLKVLD